jgi:ABC-type lipoprotein release transport system permease subunit
LIVPAALILTLAIAIFPARKAGKLKPAFELRTE